MSMYNMLFGVNEHYKILLKMLNLTTNNCGRFRDCYLNEGKIIIHTRNGGNNREDYAEVIEKLREHPNYIRDFDDDFDCTYADFEFSIPVEYMADIKNIDSVDYTPSEKWQLLFKEMKKSS